MQNNISKHIGHDIEIVERDGVVDLRCRTCKQGIVRVEKQYAGKSVREEKAIKDVMKIAKGLGYNFPSESSMKVLVDDVLTKANEGESYYNYIYEKINRRITNASIELHYFALGMSEVFNLPVVAAKQYGDKGYDEIYVDIGGRLIGSLGQSNYKALEEYVRVEKGKIQKITKYLRESGVQILEGQLEETVEYIRGNVEVRVLNQGEVESLDKHTDGKKEILKMKSGKEIQANSKYSVAVIGWL